MNVKLPLNVCKVLKRMIMRNRVGNSHGFSEKWEFRTSNARAVGF